MKKNVAIMLIVNREYLFALGAFLFNLKSLSINDSLDSVIIYYEGIRDDELKCLYEIDNRCEFVEYSLMDFLRNGLCSTCLLFTLVIDYWFVFDPSQVSLKKSRAQNNFGLLMNKLKLCL